MPTYDYKCPKCNNAFELFRSIKDSSTVVCEKPECDGIMEKQLSAPVGFVLKGAGFHANDYK